MKILDGSYSDLKHKHLVLHVHNSLKAENKTQEASRWPQSEHHLVAAVVGY